MSTVLTDGPSVSRAAPAERLRRTRAAARVAFTWLGVRKALTPLQREQAAEQFGAEGPFLTAGKKLLDTSHPAWQRVAGVRHQVVQYWKDLSLPFPEVGVRLIRQDDVPAFEVQLTTYRQELLEAVAMLDARYSELRSAAQQRLGALYNPRDYPASLQGLFGLSWDYPSVEPPDYLRELSPRLYEEESRRVASRFDEAVRLAEETFATELSRLVEHLAERLSDPGDGRPKVFRDSAVEGLREFFQRFRLLSVRSDAGLDALVEQAQQLLRGVGPQELRDSQALRQEVVTGIARVQTQLDHWLTDRPRRNVVRQRRAS